MFIGFLLKDKIANMYKYKFENNSTVYTTSSISEIKEDSSSQNKTEQPSTVPSIKSSDKNNNEKLYTEHSLEQRELKISIVGKDSSKNKMAILGSIHGDEPQGKYIVEQLIEYIKKNPEIIEDKQILFIPNVNPDGFSKNTRGNANKVDLNRNFPTKNWVSNKDDKNSRYYAGSKAASEPETKILMKYIGEFNPEVIVSIHSPLKVINYDGTGSKKIASLMSKYNHYKTADDIGYPTPGSLGTYYGKERNIPVITLETDSNSGEDAWAENKDSLIALLKNLGHF